MPARSFSNNQVLRFTHHRHHAAQGGPDAGMHHQAAQEGAELFQHLAVVIIDLAVIKQVIAGT